GFVVATDDVVRLHFLDWDDPGASASPTRGALGVLLLHGLASTAWSWTPVARRLRRAGRVIAMDLRGHGLSDAPTGGYDREALAGDAIAVAEGAGLLALPGEPPAGPLVLAGIGYGAIVAAWTAHALGDRCAGLVLVDGGWEDLAVSTEATPEEWLAEIDEPPEVLASMAAWLADREAFDAATWDADEERAARAQVVETAAGRVKLAVHPHALAGSVRAMWSYDPAAVLPEVQAPIVALVARDEDGTHAATLRDVAQRRLEEGRSPVLATAFPGRGHNLARYEPGVVSAAVLAVAAGATMRP
ncbi:MAG TPA: alpha/beta hydrolase, partial [Candidatus Nanopelagicales bacterium]|nr:alpha/beta hydrolase [Candidatus Nanopelagicales bacterium]